MFVFSQISWREYCLSWTLRSEGSLSLKLPPMWLVSFHLQRLQMQMVRILLIKHINKNSKYVWNEVLESIIDILNTGLVILVTRSHSRWRTCERCVAFPIHFQGQRWGMCFQASQAALRPACLSGPADVQLLYLCQCSGVVFRTSPCLGYSLS